jgi:hypothetical protein
MTDRTNAKMEEPKTYQTNEHGRDITKGNPLQPQPILTSLISLYDIQSILSRLLHTRTYPPKPPHPIIHLLQPAAPKQPRQLKTHQLASQALMLTFSEPYLILAHTLELLARLPQPRLYMHLPATLLLSEKGPRITRCLDCERTYSVRAIITSAAECEKRVEGTCYVC